MDFYKIKEYPLKKDLIEIYPDFIIGQFNDLMVRGRSFYAVWDESIGMWSKNELDVAKLVDADLYSYYDKCMARNDGIAYRVKAMSNFSSGVWETYKKMLSKFPDKYHQLDTSVTFANTPTTKKDYISKRLNYSMEAGSTEAYDKLLSVLYSDTEREKLEWAIGAIIAGDAKKIHKFEVLYGAAGTGKSTILNIIEKLFSCYCATFNAKELTSGSQFATGSMFNTDPLVCIQHDGDLSDIRDNSILNSIVAHEDIMVNEKFKSQYTVKNNAFLFLGTNKPVKITDAKSGLIRRLIDVTPTGDKIPPKEYERLYSQIDFELGAIANRCYEVYKELGKNYYNSYRPINMMYKTDPFFNFVQEYYDIFNRGEYITLKAAYMLYKEYYEDSGRDFFLRKYEFREELKNYFDEYRTEYHDSKGAHVTNVFIGFKSEKFIEEQAPVQKEPTSDFLNMDSISSVFDEYCKDCPAQYATENGTPEKAWMKVKTKLRDLDTSRLHYVQPYESIVTIDFDKKDKDGNKNYELNAEAASKFPQTYAELSKSGQGIHLHYIYDGDVSKLSNLYDTDIEIKMQQGNSALRRKLSKCNNLPIAHIKEGSLPLKGVKKMVNFDGLKSEKALRTIIEKNLRKEYHQYTKPSIDFIYDTLEKAYNSGLKYDVSDMSNAVFTFAMRSTNNADYCIKQHSRMKFKSEEPSENHEAEDKTDIVFFDVEVFPNLFIICYKKQGVDGKPLQLINPSPSEVEALLKYKLVGFNNRKYDNHIIYAAMMGYDNMALFKLSQKIINEKTGFFGEAYNLSYTDIYDFSSAANKQSLKKWEIALGIHHQENSYKWDQPVPEDKWSEVADYCSNDVMATERVFEHLSGDWAARQILAKWAGMTCNDTTNSLSTRIIFGKNKTPQSEFNYRDLSKPVRPSEELFSHYRKGKRFRLFNDKGEPLYQDYIPGMDLPEGYSIMPFFPGYKFDKFQSSECETIDYDGSVKKKKTSGHSSYKDVETVGEGGYVYSEPGMYGRAKTKDVTSQHPSSISEEDLFGPDYTVKFDNLKQGRIAIKYGDIELAKSILPEIVHEYLSDRGLSKALANALKTVINSVYGLTSAKFANPFRDPRNVDNIVAKRGALFMINLRNEVQARGFTVIHCKTDSIKIVNPTDEIEEFIQRYGEEFGYKFETEHVFERICLVNKSTYIARLAEDDPDVLDGDARAGEWTATGDQFKVPYVFKTLFSGEAVTLEDMSETKSVKSSLYLDMNENLKEDEHKYIFVGRVGQFCPIAPGFGGGVLLRVSGEDENGNLKYAAAEGTKGWRWKETEVVRNLGLESQIDLNYWRVLVDDAIETMNKFGDAEVFRTAEHYIYESPKPDFEKDIEELPWDENDAGKDVEFMNLPTTA